MVRRAYSHHSVCQQSLLPGQKHPVRKSCTYALHLVCKWGYMEKKQLVKDKKASTKAQHHS